jgi:hypothetical protein
MILIGCSKPAGATPIRVTPRHAWPGQTVLLGVQKAAFQDAGAVRVTIADRSAPVVRVVDSKTVEVMVPDLPPGGAPVRIKYPTKTVGRGTITIVPAPMRRVFLRMENDTVTVESVQPYNGEYDRSAAQGRRLSYDVFSHSGRFLYTAAIPHPSTGTFEVFGPAGSQSPRRVPAREPYLFVIKIPQSPGETVVKLYDTGEGMDLSNGKDRAARRLVKEIRIGETKTKKRPWQIRDIKKVRIRGT